MINLRETQSIIDRFQQAGLMAKVNTKVTPDTGGWLIQGASEINDYTDPNGTPVQGIIEIIEGLEFGVYLQGEELTAHIEDPQALDDSWQVLKTTSLEQAIEFICTTYTQSVTASNVT